MRRTPSLLAVAVAVLAAALPAAAAPRPLKVGQVFSIRLQETPSTGTIWVYGTKLPPQLRPLGSEFTPWQGNPRPGAPGVRTFTFRAVARGKGVVRLVLVKPWEPTAPPLKRAGYPFVVR